MKPLACRSRLVSGPGLAALVVALGAFALTVALLGAVPVAARQVTDRYAPESVGGGGPKTLVHARHWMVVTAEPSASAAGAAILRAGGNAMDAAVAVQLVLGLTEPQSSGLGGGAFLLYWDAARKRLTSYDGRETAPAAATPRLFLDDAGQPLRFMDAVVGGRSVGTPGVPRLLALVHREHGKLSWARLFRPAVRLAESGFVVPPRLAAGLVRERATLLRDPVARRYFFPGGVALKAGARVRNPAYARTLRRLARQGPAAFYRGPIAADIIRAVRHAPGNPGRLVRRDLAAYRVVERPSVCAPYRVWKVCGMGPPSSGGIAIGQILGMLEPYDLAALGPRSPAAWRLIANASQLAFADRERYVADSDFVPVPVAGLLDQTYLRRRARLLATDRALHDVRAGDPTGSRGLNRGRGAALELPSTSHFTIVDAAGNVVSMTSSIESAFGARLMVDGFMLNNELTDFSFRPIDDRGRPVANRVEGGKRPRSSMSPTIVFKDERPVLAIGSPGGSAIVGIVLKALIGWMDWDLDIQQAIDLPNVLDRFGPVEIEAGTPATAMVPALRAMGFATRLEPIPSGLYGIAISPDGLSGGADPRRDGLALGG